MFIERKNRRPPDNKYLVSMVNVAAFWLEFLLARPTSSSVRYASISEMEKSIYFATQIDVTDMKRARRIHIEQQ